MSRPNTKTLLRYIPLLAGHKVLVIGDLFLDEYIVGEAERLSREAPVPVLAFRRQFHLPGGAANPAHNIVALGSRATVLGVVGEDAEGERLTEALKQVGIDTAGVITDPSRPTTLKTRVVAEGTLVFPQQLVRIDRQVRTPLSPEVEDILIQRLSELVPSMNAVLISDYRSGVVTPRLVDECQKLIWKYERLGTVDCQGNPEKFKRFEVVRVHQRDLEAQHGHPFTSEADLTLAATRLLRELEAGLVLIGRGGEGMAVVSRQAGFIQIPAANRTEVFDVTGAGDTVISVVTLGLLAGASGLIAAYLASYAAGLVVRKLGNATPSPDELAWAIRHWEMDT